MQIDLIQAVYFCISKKTRQVDLTQIDRLFSFISDALPCFAELAVFNIFDGKNQ